MLFSRRVTLLPGILSHSFVDAIRTLAIRWREVYIVALGPA